MLTIVLMACVVEKEEAKLVGVDRKKTHERGVVKLEEELKEATSKMSGQKLWINVLSAVSFFFLYRVVAAKWTGHVVARLPFLPLPVIQSLSRRGIQGDDLYQCGFGLIYTLCTMGLKQNIPKALGFAPPVSAYNPSRAAARMQKSADKQN